MRESEQYGLRAFRQQDAQTLLSITRAAIVGIGRRAYNDAQIAVWSESHTSARRFVERAEDGHRIVIADDKSGTAVAFALWEPDGHFDMLYCHPDHASQGLAGRLIEHVLGQANARGLDRMWTEASDLARPVFERAGFAVLQRREFDLHGVTIHNWAMEKRL